MPRGYRNMYVEYVSVRQHVLQVSATGEKDLLAKMAEHARGEWVEGFQVSDDGTPILFHEPYGSPGMGPQEDGPFIYAGSPFEGESPHWLRKVARDLLAMADKLDDPPVELLETGTARDEDCPRCAFPETGYALTPKVTDAGERNVYQRCSKCGWQKNLGWFKPEYNALVATIVQLNEKEAP